nr:MAG TPA: hypothetical protein [Bacteriophage sp.]
MGFLESLGDLKRYFPTPREPCGAGNAQLFCR